MILVPVPGDSWESSEVVVVDLVEAQLVCDQLRHTVDALESLIHEAQNQLPHERARIPQLLPDWFYD